MQSDGTMTSRQYRRMQKRCRECGKRDAYTEAGRLYCAECRARANELQRGMSADQKAHKAAGEKALREARKAAGICPKCGKREITPGYLTCDICRSKNRRRMRGVRAESGVTDTTVASALGLCTRCRKNTPVEGRKLCAECAAWWESVRNREKVDNAFTRSMVFNPKEKCQ